MDTQKQIAGTDTVAVMPPKRTKVALVGFASTYKHAPYDDPSWEIWGINELWKYLGRWDRWFELHKRDVFAKEGNREQAAHVAWLQSQNESRPIYMLERFDDIPGSVPYPLKAMSERFFPGQERPYFTSSISYMLALAIAEGFTEIALYGIDLAADVEYMHQRPSAEYLIGVARGMGITVTIAPGSALLKSDGVYGYDQQLNQKDVPLTLAWYRERVRVVTENRAKTLDLLHHHDGLLEEAAYHCQLAEQKARGVQWPA